MGGLMGNLTNAMPSLGGHMYDSGQQAAMAGSAQMPSADSMMGADVLNPHMDTSAMPPMISKTTPKFSQAANSGPGGTPNALSPALSTKGKLLTILLNAAKGAGAGAGSMTFGQGFSQGGELPFIQGMRKQELQKGQLEAQLAQAQIQNIPFLREQQKAAMAHTNAQTEQSKAAAAKDTAEAAAVPGKTAREAAEANAAKYKGEGGALYDISGSQPVLAAQAPIKPQKPDTPEQQFIDEYQLRHKGSGVQEAERAYAQNQHIVDPAAAGAKNDARLDKSYQFNQGRLDKARKPVDDMAARFSRLQDTLNQHSPQADALVAPELLTVMAGGAGSGVRINEAEIARVVGGRSVWENLKGSMQKWSLDPTAARSITPEQDKQIRALIAHVGGKITAKQKALEDAENGLLDAEDVGTHRKVVAEAQTKLNAIDNSGGVDSPDPGTGGPPAAKGGFAAWKASQKKTKP